MTVSEKEIQNQCISFLNDNGFFAWRNNMGGVVYKGRMMKNANSGAPDVFAIKSGAFFCIEFKTKTGKVADHQKAWLNKARAKGAYCFVIRSLDDLVTVLVRIGALEKDYKPESAFLPQSKLIFDTMF